MKTVLGYLRPHALRVAAGAAIKFTAAILELILPLLLARVIDDLVPAGDTAAIWRTGGWMALLALGAVGCNITANRMAAWVSMEMTRVLRQDLLPPDPGALLRPGGPLLPLLPGVPPHQ